MYRQYEDPSTLEKMLEQAQEEYDKAKQEGADAEELFDKHEAIEELKDRIRFAWDDIEYEENCARYGY